MGTASARQHHGDAWHSPCPMPAGPLSPCAAGLREPLLPLSPEEVEAAAAACKQHAASQGLPALRFNAILLEVRHSGGGGRGALLHQFHEWLIAALSLHQCEPAALWASALWHDCYKRAAPALCVPLRSPPRQSSCPGRQAGAHALPGELWWWCCCPPATPLWRQWWSSAVQGEEQWWQALEAQRHRQLDVVMLHQAAPVVAGASSSHAWCHGHRREAGTEGSRCALSAAHFFLWPDRSCCYTRCPPSAHTPLSLVPRVSLPARAAPAWRAADDQR